MESRLEIQFDNEEMVRRTHGFNIVESPDT
jgi:hypothetical protein